MEAALIIIILCNLLAGANNPDVISIIIAVLSTLSLFIILGSHNKRIEDLNNSSADLEGRLDSARAQIELLNRSRNETQATTENNVPDEHEEVEQTISPSIPLETITASINRFNKLMEGKYFAALLDDVNAVAFTDLFTSKTVELKFIYFNSSFVFLWPDKIVYVGASSVYSYESWFLKISQVANRYAAYDFINNPDRMIMLADFFLNNQTVIPLGSVKDSKELEEFYNKLVKNSPPDLAFKLTQGNIKVFKNGIPSSTFHKFKKFPTGKIGCYLSNEDYIGYYSGNNYIPAGFYKAGKLVATNKLYHNSPEITLLSIDDDLLLWYQYFEFVLQTQR